MALCAICATSLDSEDDRRDGINAYHLALENGFGPNNRLVCATVHEGVVPTRLSTSDRDAIVEDETSGGD